MMGRFDSIPPSAPAVSTRSSDFWLLDGILYGRTRPKGPHGGIDHAVDAVSKIRALTGDTRLPLVFDACHVGWLQIKARDYVHRHAAELFTMAAVIVQPAAKRLLLRAFLGGVRVEIPVELFLDEQSAWDYVSQSRVP